MKKKQYMGLDVIQVGCLVLKEGSIVKWIVISRAQIGFQSWRTFPRRHLYPSPLLLNCKTSLSLLLSCFTPRFTTIIFAEWNLCFWEVTATLHAFILRATISLEFWGSLRNKKSHMQKVFFLLQFFVFELVWQMKMATCETCWISFQEKWCCIK